LHWSCLTECRTVDGAEDGTRVGMPRRAKSHETDEAAQGVFKAAIPKDWVVREQRPDYGLDYVVEIFEGGGGRLASPNLLGSNGVFN